MSGEKHLRIQRILASRGSEEKERSIFGIGRQEDRETTRHVDHFVIRAMKPRIS